MRRYEQPGILDFHGDAEVEPGLVDLAVNVRTVPAPEWLAAPIASSLGRLAAYPDQRTALHAVAARHGRDPAEVLLVAGAAQAFTLIAAGYGRQCTAAVVHPQFTEPEAALRKVGAAVHRVVLKPADGFRLDPAAVPEPVDLLILGNPTNPTSVRHPAATIEQLARPGRLLVVDEAFADTIPGEPESLSRRRDLPGLVVIRSLTKTWGLAGLRIGYVLAAPDIIERLAAQQPLWPVSTPALAAAIACAGPVAVAEEQRIATELADHREHLIKLLAAIDGVTIAGEPASSFILIHVWDADHRLGGADVRRRLRAAGFAVRRGDTFPGLGPDWIRVAVREPAVSDMFAAAFHAILAEIMEGSP